MTTSTRRRRTTSKARTSNYRRSVRSRRRRKSIFGLIPTFRMPSGNIRGSYALLGLGGFFLLWQFVIAASPQYAAYLSASSAGLIAMFFLVIGAVFFWMEWAGYRD